MNESAPPGLPRWVKISAATVTLLVLVLIVVMVASGEHHGPGRHGAEGASHPTSPKPVLSASVLR
jgi:hypothetical protein